MGFEPNAVAEATGFDSGLQVSIASLYPPCPQPELALGMHPHSDHGFLVLHVQIEISGLQISHNGKWVNVSPFPTPSSSTLQINLRPTPSSPRAICGKQSVLHRAVVNKKETRKSVVTANGPDLEKVVEPMPELMKTEEAVFRGMKFNEYYELQQKIPSSQENE
ncbi:2-oxoglutarate-dependent dioxygenase 19-like [Prosopis cineraria]|uniref:2-oxoglutarate-dependent dioxygenase 19-like n=1 Tax=Prosopis cineraria TaxID=364024 RepID=UPI00240FD3EE|nr:2-oxoglutarate-dependent dioxygenase 19-like [Prosopis cineraria]